VEADDRAERGGDGDRSGVAYDEGADAGSFYGDDDGGGVVKSARKGTAFDAMNNLAAHLVRTAAALGGLPREKLRPSRRIRRTFVTPSVGAANASTFAATPSLCAPFRSNPPSVSTVQLTNLTASMRFEGPLNVDLNEITSCLVPFPRMHLLQSRFVCTLEGRCCVTSGCDSSASLRETGRSHVCVFSYFGDRHNRSWIRPPTLAFCSISPLFFPPDAAALSGQSRVLDAMFSGAFHKDAQLIRGDPRRSVHLACGLLARGDVPVSDVTRNVERLQRELHMVHWNPDGGCGDCYAAERRGFAGSPLPSRCLLVLISDTLTPCRLQNRHLRRAPAASAVQPALPVQ
jgi:hypothetical protein